MAAAFVLFGELRADTTSFEKAMRNAESVLKGAEAEIQKMRKAAVDAGDASATTARKFEKMSETTQSLRQRMNDAGAAFQNGTIGAKKFASEITSIENKTGGLNSRLRDMGARIQDFGRRASTAASVFKGTLGALGVANFGLMAKNFVQDGAQLIGTLDKLTRFTATLDKNFQTPAALKKFQNDVRQLALEMPQSAESIAQASFTLKSAFQDLSEADLVDYLRKFGAAATASNTDIATHTQSVAAMAKQYNITKKDIDSFNALLKTSYGIALASDAQIAQGFNQVLNSAKALNQPLVDLTSAMGTLQSVSGDAAHNTMLLQNIYSKLTDKKYREGLDEMGVSVFNASGNFKSLNEIINELAKKLAGLSDKQKLDLLAWAKDQQAREGILALVKNVDAYNKAIADAKKGNDNFNASTDLMANSVAAKWQHIENRMNEAKMTLAGVVVQMMDDIDTLQGHTKTVNTSGWFKDIAPTAKIKIPPPQLDENAWRSVITQSLRKVITGSYGPVAPTASELGQNVGRNIDLGLATGIDAGQSGVISAAIRVAMAAWYAAKDALGIQSPSKKFFEIGKDTAQGFIDGIEAMKTGVARSVAEMLDVSSLTNFTKKDKAIVELLGQLGQAYDDLFPKTERQRVLAKLQSKELSEGNQVLKDRALWIAEMIDKQNAWNRSLERFQEITAQEGGRDDGAGADGLRYSTDEGDEDPLGAPKSTILDDAGMSPPKVNFYKTVWNDFWNNMRSRLNEFKNSLPSLKQAIGENLLSGIQGIGDAFANAMSSWANGYESFSKALLNSFRSLVSQIVAELERLLVMKAIFAIIGAFSGGIGGASGGGIPIGGGGSGGLGHGGFASGGYTGDGPTSAFAGFVHGKEFVFDAASTQRIGVANLQAMQAGATPGGPVINFNISGGSPGPGTIEQMQRMAIAALDKHQRRNK